MKTASLVLGIVGGLLGLIVGFFGYGFASVGTALADATGSNESYVLYKIVGIGAPIACIAGGALSPSQPTIAAILMAASALAMAFVFGIGAFTIFPIALAGVGAVLAFLREQGNHDVPHRPF